MLGNVYFPSSNLNFAFWNFKDILFAVSVKAGKFLKISRAVSPAFTYAIGQSPLVFLQVLFADCIIEGQV
jgi:hypothetical protein